MAWMQLILAGIFEIGWAISIKYTEGFTKLIPSLGMIIVAAISFYFLSAALKSIPIGTAYVVFTGIGAIGTVIFGMMFLGESREISKILCILLVIIGTVGLKFFVKE